MLYALRQHKPRLEGSGHFIAASADIIGNVRLHAETSVWFGAVIRGDNDLIEVGERSNLQDGSLLHTDPGIKLRIGQEVTVGHQAMLHGCTIGDGSLVGIQAVVLNRARIGSEVLIGAKTLVPENMVIPDGVLVIGSPAKIKRELTAAERRAIRLNALHYREKAREYLESLQAC